VVTADRPPFRGSVRVRAGVIESVSDRAEPDPATPSLDVGDRYILPGFVDVHVHTSSRPEEGMGRTTAAAAAGGVTTMIDMPYDVPRPIDHPELVATKAAQICRDAHVDVALLATVPPSGGAPLVPALLEAGACGIMVSLWEQDRRRFPRIEYGELREIFREAAVVGGVVSMHPETDGIIRPLLEEAMRSPDQTDWRLHAGRLGRRASPCRAGMGTVGDL
jgi:allantoinase